MFPLSALRPVPRGAARRQRADRPVGLVVCLRHGGSFILSLDDTDRLRGKPEYEAAMERDLLWPGLDWARKEQQADRWRTIAGRAVEPGDLEIMDVCPLRRRDPSQGESPVPSSLAGAHGARDRPEMPRLLPLIGRANRRRGSAGSRHEEGAEAKRNKRQRCHHAHDLERQTLGDGVAEQNDRRVGHQHAERGAGSDSHE